MRPLSVAALVAVVVSVAGAQQQTDTRWSVFGGPTMAIYRDRIADGPRAICMQCGPEDYPISGAAYGKLHFGLSASRPLRNTSLTERFEMFYSLSESAPETYRIWNRTPTIYSRSALKDETFFAGSTFQWDAMPTRRGSPYLLTSGGLLFNRVGWSRDPASTHVDEQHDVVAAAIGLGGGIRVPFGKHETFFEWRRFWAPVAPGSSIAPFSFGFRW